MLTSSFVDVMTSPLGKITISCTSSFKHSPSSSSDLVILVLLFPTLKDTTRGSNAEAAMFSASFFSHVKRNRVVHSFWF